MGLPVTVLVQTRNEAIGIRACLESLAEFDEVIVVDSNSTDGTPEIATEMGHRVVNFTWDGHYPKKKQWQLDNVQTKHRWILFLDADETPTPQFIVALDALFAQDSSNQGNPAKAFDLQLIYVFDGKPLQHGHRVWKRALLDAEHARFPEVNDLSAPGMGELEGHYQPIVNGQVHRFKDAILHDDRDPVRTWFDRHNRYSDWEAHLRTQHKSRSSVAALRSRQGRIFDRVPAKSVAFFVYAFFVKRGFLDGQPGLNYALALSQYYWQIGLKVRESRRGQSR